MKKALISVSDKTRLKVLLDVLGEYDVQIICSGGTALKIKELGYERMIEVSEYTEYPESPDGLLKTIHPKIHGGLLLNWNNPKHKQYMDDHQIEPIEMVVSNLYPFEEVIKDGADENEASKNIDIGGPTMIRSAAKAAHLYKTVVVVTNPEQYNRVATSLKENEGEIPDELKTELANEAFDRTSKYDTAIVQYFSSLSKNV